MRAPFLLSAAVSLLLAGCGIATTTTTIQGKIDVPGDADPADVAVIQGWVSALDEGNVDKAAGYFALPSVAVNGPSVQIKTANDARAFNASLPCGAELIRAVSHAGFTIATFRLSERPGAGRCGAGSGGTAATAFKIENGKIAEWRRVPVSPESQPPRVHDQVT